MTRDLSLTDPLPAPLLIGDHIAADFLNSVGAPYGRLQDWLRDGTAFINWLEAVGVIQPEEALVLRAQSGDLWDQAADEARALRESLRACLETPADAPLDAINDALAAGPTTESLVQDRSGLRVEVGKPLTPHGILARIALEAAGFLALDAPERTKQCQGEGCSFWFRDTSRNGARRWCSMQICGNRAKVRAHRARGKSAN